MQESGYRIRAAEPSDVPQLRESIVRTLAHPTGDGKRTSYKGAAERGELMLLERYNPREKTWRIEGFVEYHLRVDDTLTIRDVGSSSDPPNPAAVKFLLLDLLRTVQPVSATVKVRQDAAAWNEILQNTPGWSQEGREYRRPHYIIIWRWSREAAERALRGAPRGRRRP
jgi:hypothetical protein